MHALLGGESKDYAWATLSWTIASATFVLPWWALLDAFTEDSCHGHNGTVQLGALHEAL